MAARVPVCPGSLAELIESEQEERDDGRSSRFGQEVFEQAAATSGDLADPGYLELRGKATRIAQRALEAPFREHDLEAVIAGLTRDARPG